MVDELWQKNPLGHEKDDDKQIKKTIAINFRMLSNSNNTAQRSSIFNSLKEACHDQRQQGGRIYEIDERNRKKIPRGLHIMYH